MKKTQQIILTLTVALVVQFCFLQQLVTAHANESVIARRMMENGHPERSYYQPFFTGYFNRDVYVAAVLSNDVYEDDFESYNLVPEYSRIMRYKNDINVFNIYVSDSEKKAIFSFRGTDFSSYWDALQNLNFLTSSYQIAPNMYIKIHTGFLAEILGYKQLLKQYANYYYNSGYRIIWTGHSQGGALAQVAATIIGQELSISMDRAHLITFGSPAAGKSDFATFASRLVKHTRIVNAYPCDIENCFEVDFVSDIIPGYTHFGDFHPIQTDYSELSDRHSMNNYQAQVKSRVMIYDLISLILRTNFIIYGESTRIYYDAFECKYSNLVLSFNKSGSIQQEQLSCTSGGVIGISRLSVGEYNLQGMVSGYPILTVPNKLTIAKPPFQCPFSCNGCDYSSNNCTSCVNGFYGPLCQFYCSPNCLSCKNAASCLTCKNPTISSPPTCAPKCSNCVNGQCIDGQCVCNTGYGGVNCASIICPTNCLQCSSPYLCSSCSPRTFGATCSFTCIPNCLQCSDDKTCTKCDAGYSGSTCGNGPNYFLTSVVPINTGFSGSYSLPYRVRYIDPDGYLGIGNRRDIIFTFTIPGSNQSPTQSIVFSNASYAPFIALRGYGSNFIATTSVSGVLLVTPSVTSASWIPNSPSMIYNTGINETFINIQSNSFFSFYLTNAGNVRSFGEFTGSGCYPSGFFGVYKTNFTRLDIPQTISLLSCSTTNSLCFAYSRDSRRLYGWGLISYAYYGVNQGICQYTPLELDITTFGNEIILSITITPNIIMYVMESGKVFYTGTWDSLGRFSYPTLISSSFIGTSERIIKATFNYDYNAFIFTTYSIKSFVTSTFFKFLYPASTPSTTGNLWNTPNQVAGRLYYYPTICNGLFDIDPSVCSGNGVCEEYNMCYCKQGYAGSNCEFPTCAGKRADVASVCSGVGSCLGPNNCSCPNGYNGTNCEFSALSSATNCLPSASNCQSCANGFYDTSKLCKYKCMVNCEVCSSGETCDKCLGDMKGPNCNEKVCKASNCAACSTITGYCLECNDGLYGDICNSTCPSNCKSCSSESSCTTCKPGWSGSQCNIPVCNENCIQCSSPNQCARCFNGLFGSDCSGSCLSECESCTNSTSCLTCPPFSSGSKCEIQTENCLTFINSPPKVSVSNLGSSMLMYSISVSNILSKSSNMTRISFSEITDCVRNINSSDIVLNSTKQLTCESQYSIVTSISDLVSDSRVTQQLDASGIVLTLTVPIYIGLISDIGYCQVTNYKVEHQIKLLLSSHQYIDMGVVNSNGSYSQISFRREILSVSNNKLKVSGTVFSQKATIEGVVFVKSEPSHNVSFDVSLQFRTSGEYYMTIIAREYLSYYSGDFTFQVYAKSPEGDVYQVPLYISLTYYMPINPPPSEFKLLTQLGLYSDNFKEAKNLFQLSERPHVVVKVLDTNSKPASLQNTVRISIKNAYLCCVSSGRPMPTFDLTNGQLGCTSYNPLLMTSWHQLVRNQSEISQYSSTIIKFPFVNNQIAFSFKLTSQMFSNSSYGTINDCFIHTETILTNDGASSRRIESSTSVVENYHSFDIVRLVDNQMPVQPSASDLTTSTKVLNSAIVSNHSVLVVVLILTIGLFVM